MNLQYSSLRYSLRKKCLYSELFWSVFSRIRTEYGEILRMRENTDQNNSEYGHFLRSDSVKSFILACQSCEESNLCLIGVFAKDTPMVVFSTITQLTLKRCIYSVQLFQ